VNRDCLTLFAGGGIADCGIHAAGWRTVGAVEWDPQIAAVFAENHGLAPLVAGVETVDCRPFAGVDAVWASPCCTNASVAKANGEEAPEDLSAAEAVCRCLREARPRVFALENVWGYRTFRAFALIVETLRELGYAVRYEHLNAADFGVPQTRKRLILRARRDGLPVLPLPPTHAEYVPGGGLFGDEETGCLPPWNGWYAAVEDLLPTCPPSQFAAWQLKRLPAELATFLLMTGNTSEEQAAAGVGVVYPKEPANAVYAQPPSVRAFLVDCVHRTDAPLTTVDEDAPSFTVKATDFRRPCNVPRALLVHGTSTLEAREAAEPAACVVGTVSAKAARPRALLVDDQYGSNHGREERNLRLRGAEEPSFTPMACGKPGRMRAFLVDARQGRNADEEPPTARAGEEPVWSLAATRGGDRYRAWPEQGRVVSLTPRCLARFQSIPDTYRLPEKSALACRIVGNGAPPLLAQRVMESLR
jgi:site-specific DNA-cytosine methylase